MQGGRIPKNISVDVKTVQRAFREHHLTNPLYITSNGEKALEFLRREGRYAQSADAPRPGLILLDLNMPVMNGIEFLRIISDRGLVFDGSFFRFGGVLGYNLSMQRQQ